MRGIDVVGELFMMVLAVIAAPSDLKEFRVDLIEQSGRIETLIVQRTDIGFTLLEQQGDKFVERGSIRPVAGKQEVFALKLGNGPEKTIDLAAGIQGFTCDALQKARSVDLKASDGVKISVYRSGAAVYLTPEGKGITYACH